MTKEIFYKIKQSKDKFHQKVNENLRDRIHYQANDTLSTIQRLKNRGLSEQRILNEVLKSSEVKKHYEGN